MDYYYRYWDPRSFLVTNIGLVILTLGSSFIPSSQYWASITDIGLSIYPWFPILGYCYRHWVPHSSLFPNIGLVINSLRAARHFIGTYVIHPQRHAPHYWRREHRVRPARCSSKKGSPFLYRCLIINSNDK